MNEKWSGLYEAMMQEMESCLQPDSDNQSVIECRFNISLKYWTHIGNELEDLRFNSDMDEIEFYKIVKPKFKSEMEYHNQLYQSDILRPSDPPELKEFWIREQQKFDKYILQHKDFYTYYKSGATNRDEELFLWAGHEDEKGNSFYYDDLIATLMALEKYNLFIQGELSRHGYA